MEKRSFCTLIYFLESISYVESLESLFCYSQETKNHSYILNIVG